MDINTAPPLDMDLASVEIPVQLLTEGIYDFQIKTAENKLSKNGKKMLAIQHSLVSQGVNSRGEPVNPGFVVHDNLMLETSGKSTQVQVNTALIEFAKAFGGGITMMDLNQGTPLCGKVGKIKIGIKPASFGTGGQSYKERNEVMYYVIPK